jgi:hypothetical protein
MLNFMKRIVVLWALAFGFLPFVSAQDNGVTVTATLSLEQNQLLPDEDMDLKVHIENRSGQNVILGTAADWITFTVTGENNSIAPQLGQTSVAHEFTLPSAEAVKCSFNLTPYFNFRAPGHYTITATIKIPQWNQACVCKPVTFTVINGMRLSKVPDLQFGVPPPPGVSNTAPVVRRYFLERVDLGDAGIKLYLRLTDSSGAKTLKALQLGRMISLSDPDVLVDRLSNLHVLNQTGARAFSYYVVNPEGELLYRQTYEYTQTKPKLARGDWGEVKVQGGLRHVSENDFPSIVEHTGSTTNL